MIRILKKHLTHILKIKVYIFYISKYLYIYEFTKICDFCVFKDMVYNTFCA